MAWIVSRSIQCRDTSKVASASLSPAPQLVRRRSMQLKSASQPAPSTLTKCAGLQASRTLLRPWYVVPL